MNAEGFEQEERYLIIKTKDIQKYLNHDELVALRWVTAKIAASRHTDKKPPILKGVVIESDWQCYEKAWELVQKEWEARQKPTLD